MQIHLLGLFSLNRKEDISFLDLSYLRHDPNTNVLLVYNNGLRSAAGIRIEVKNEELVSFIKNFEKLSARSANPLPLADLFDSLHRPFSGKIKDITLHYKGQKKVFIPDADKFSRIP